MNIPELDDEWRSYWPEIMNKIENDAPLPELEKLLLLQSVTYNMEAARLSDAITPDQINLRKKEALRSLRTWTQLPRSVRQLAQFIRATRKQRDYVDWSGKKFSYMLQQLVDLAVDCLRKTGQSDTPFKTGDSTFANS